ncbi:cupin [Nocardia neocaledoniensis NBRC 108232]|uniref:Quercetin dioxygenase-like cupin family protein n=1 Tax=Nocardia neocaledoniensis TaxID=236511 RepID=A0A317NM77_9NOCA|nr:cupin domain-containing protein [Nocardia neocaledoniensis]PWV76107.1 quercetin dioxygenase-like cupin family protein [Nocardia neocaledoniensis]GEM34199.1 cupin [Nocardia neocaledoniensis NBRC 108232]
MTWWRTSSFQPNPAPAVGTASRTLLRVRLGRRDIVVRRTRIAPGGSSGWHYHDGTLFVLVTRGVLDHPYVRRGPAVYPRGHVFREPSGPANAHVARNLGATEVRILVLYLNPAGSPLSRQVSAP